jgi:hypothetical protein
MTPEGPTAQISKSWRHAAMSTFAAKAQPLEQLMLVQFLSRKTWDNEMIFETVVGVQL